MAALCHCGKPLHYTDKNVERTVSELCAALGDYMNVTVMPGAKTYRVQRHYVALHGIKGKDLAQLGFAEVE